MITVSAQHEILHEAEFMTQKIVTVIGGTGFVGRYAVQALARAGYQVRVVARSPQKYAELKTFGDVGQISLIKGNVNDMASVAPALKGAFAVVNLVGILYENRKQRFSAIHSVAAEKLAIAAKEAGVEKFVHISALGIEHEFGSSYARSKLLGERAILAAFPTATILRPSVIFGAEDGFFNKFAQMAIFSPFIPLIGGGKTLFQPVYVGDVAKAILTVIEHPETIGEIYELGGRKTYSFKELIEYVLAVIGRKRLLVDLPFYLASILANVLEHLPSQPLTRDQVKLLKFDSVVDKQAKTLLTLGIAPRAMEDIVPLYLAKFGKKRQV